MLLLPCACSRNSDQFLRKGNELFAAHAYSEACLNYRKAVQRDEGSAEANYRLGICQDTLGQTENSLGSLLQAHRLNSKREDILAELADVTFTRYLQTGKPQKLYATVQDLVAQLLTQDPSSVTALRLQASLDLGDGKVEDAIAAFAKADRQSPGDSAIALPYADALSKAGQDSRAEQIALLSIAKHPSFGPLYVWLNNFYTSRNDPGKAESILRTYVAKNPNDLDAVLTFAVDRCRSHRLDEAKSQLNSILDNKRIQARYLAVGDVFRGCGDFSDAEHIYRSGISADSEHKNLYRLRLAGLHASQGESPAALSDLDEVLREDSGNLDAALMRLSVLANSGKLDQALADGKKLASANPDDSRVASALGRLYAQAGDTNAAREQLLSAVRQNRSNYEALSGLTVLSRDTHNYPEMLTYARQCLNIQPNDPKAKLLMASALARTGNTREAEPILKQLANEPSVATDSNLELGLLYLSTRRFAEAKATLIPLCKDGHSNPIALASLARAFTASNSLDEGLVFFRDLVNRDPDGVTGHYLLADLADRKGNQALAEQQYTMLVEKHADVPAYHLAMGQYLEMHSQPERALPYLEHAVELAPRDPVAAIDLASAYEAAGNVDKSAAVYAKAVKQGVNDPALLNNYAYLLADSGKDPAQAVRLAKTAVEKQPNDADFSDTLAYSYLKAGNNAAASDIFSDLVHRFPQRPAFRYHLALALSASGRSQEAKQQLTTGLANHPSRQEAKDIRELLTKIGS
jgi:tetratricopeptide (TPR) repeat protein